MPAIKYSRQRESIKQFLMTRQDHPSADTIYAKLREAYPNISLGTVYRNLSLLSELGEITKLSGLDNADRYDGNTAPHNHFICRKCHHVIDLEMDNTDYIRETAAKNFDGQIDGYSVNFYGLCCTCIKNANFEKTF